MSEQVLERIEQTLQELVVTTRDTNERVEALEHAVRENSERIEAETKRWDERFFQLARDNNAISRNVIVAAASVVIFGSVLRAVPDIVEAIALLSSAR